LILDLRAGSGYGVSMRKVNLKYAKDHLEDLVDEAIAGEEVVITNERSWRVRLTPIQEGRPAEKSGPASQRERIEALLARLQSLPDLDSRSAEEILGYDEKGLF
jgi:antitoxin (DNA-binding transcriptional repressor) of toxin-antitoxin stability system